MGGGANAAQTALAKAAATHAAAGRRAMRQTLRRDFSPATPIGCRASLIK
jgi:hypothetical protein